MDVVGVGSAEIKHICIPTEDLGQAETGGIGRGRDMQVRQGEIYWGQGRQGGKERREDRERQGEI